jgi:hypothetical protein
MAISREKAVSRIIDVAKQKGIVAGRGIPPKFILGPDALAGVGRNVRVR